MMEHAWRMIAAVEPFIDTFIVAEVGDDERASHSML